MEPFNFNLLLGATRFRTVANKVKAKKARKPKARLPRGFGDASGDDVLQRQEMIETVLSVYPKYCFQALETPTIEYLDDDLPDK